MDILEYLHLTARRLVVVAVVCLVAGGATAAALADSTGDYEAEVVVFAGRALPSDRSAFEVTPFVGDLATAAALEPVQTEIAEASGVAPGDVQIETQETADGSALAIRSVAATPEQAETIAFEASRVALTSLLIQEEDRAKRTVDATEAQLLDVRADLEEFRGENNTQDPIEEYRIAAEALSFVQLQLPNPALTGEGRASLEESLPTLQAELDRLAPLRAQYGELTRAEISAETAYTQARQELLEAESLVAAAANGDFVVATAAEPLSSRESLVAGVAVAVLVAGLLTIAIFVAADTLRARSTTTNGSEHGSSLLDRGRRAGAAVRRFLQPHPAPAPDGAADGVGDVDEAHAVLESDAPVSGNGAAGDAPRTRPSRPERTPIDSPASNGSRTARPAGAAGASSRNSTDAPADDGATGRRAADTSRASRAAESTQNDAASTEAVSTEAAPTEAGSTAASSTARSQRRSSAGTGAGSSPSRDVSEQSSGSPERSGSEQGSGSRTGGSSQRGSGSPERGSSEQGSGSPERGSSEQGSGSRTGGGSEQGSGSRTGGSSKQSSGSRGRSTGKQGSGSRGRSTGKQSSGSRTRGSSEQSSGSRTGGGASGFRRRSGSSEGSASSRGSGSRSRSPGDQGSAPSNGSGEGADDDGTPGDQSRAPAGLGHDDGRGRLR